MAEANELDLAVEEAAAKMDSSKYKTGQFTTEETETIKAAVRRYCAVKGVSVERLCSECKHKAELKGAWMEIAKDIPHRSVQSVYRHGLRQLHPFKRGKWSDEEVEQLIHHVDVLGKKWATIQDKLNRSADACRDKWREKSEDFQRGRWNEKEMEELKNLVRQHVKGCAPDADMKEVAAIVQSKGITIPWVAISKKMEKRSRLSCFKKWEKMAGLHKDTRSKHAKKKKKAQGETNDDSVDVTKSSEQADVVDAAPSDPDVLLLSALANTKAKRQSDVDWDGIAGVEQAQERWDELLEEFQANTTDDDVLALPFAELAKAILDQKLSAKQAADTVEAVLPTNGMVI